MFRRNSLPHSPYTLIGAVCLLAICFVLLVFSSLHVLAAERVVQPDAPGSVSGHVKDLKGDPIEDFRVVLFANDYVRFALTDKSGFYRFPIVAPNEYVVGFGTYLDTNPYLTEYYSHSTTFEGATKILVVGNQVENIDANLTQASKITGTISFASVSITDVIYTTVFAYKFDAPSSTWINVNSAYLYFDNNYVIGGLSAGTYRICASAYTKKSSSSVSCYGNASYVTGAQNIVVGAEETVTGTNIMFRDNPDYATISGRVMNISGNPISGTTVYAYPSTYFDPSPGNSNVAITNQNGDYTINTLTPNVFSYTVFFTDPNGNHLTEYYDNVASPESAKTFRLQAHQVISNVNAVLEYAAHISGTITLQGGAPFVDGSVNLFRKVEGEWQGYLQNGLDKASGNYHFAGLTAGTYRICVNFYLNSQMIGGCYGAKTVVSATDISLITGQVRGNVNFDLSTKLYEGAISGQVKAHGTPLSGIRVDLINNFGSGATCDGGFADQDSLRTIKARIASDINEVNTIYTTTDATGNYKFEGLAPGYYILEASDPHSQYGTTFYNEASNALALTGLNLDCGQIRESANISMTEAGTVSGRITIASGKPLSNTVVSLLWPNGYDSQVTEQVTFTNQEGNYLIRGVQPGTYWLRAYSTVSIYPYEYPVSEYYGSPSDVVITPEPITVTSGLTTTGIDIILGPDGILWLPLVRKEE